MKWNLSGLLILAALGLLSSCGEFHAKSDAAQTYRVEGNVVTSSSVVTPGPTTGLVRQSQLLTSLQRCLDLTDAQVSTQTKATFAAMKNNLSPEGKLQNLSSPLFMSLTQIAADICNDRIAVETGKPTRAFFQGFKLNTGDDWAGAGPAQTVEKLAKSCWGRAATKTEIETISSEFAAVPTIGTSNDKTSALFLCTAVLSSPEVIAY